MPHIFISYAKKDTRKLATDLADALNAVPGYTAWVDRSLRAGAAWELEIQREIRRCDVFVVLYSPDINRHLNGEDESYVLTEISYAKFTAKKPIIPIMTQMTEPPISLTRIHYIDFTIGGLTLADLVAAICDEVAQTSPAAHPVEMRLASSGDFLPPPFAWVEIPAGQVTLVPSDLDRQQSYLRSRRTIAVDAFSIAKYPTTNAQYGLFVDAGGYREAKWWLDVGWEKRQEQEWDEPRYWQDPIWNRPDQPVVAISWYEAIAYCHWLSEMLGTTILLPTEPQWQLAAQGSTTQKFPWGDIWDATRCNNSVSVISKGTSNVHDYESNGDSPFGVVDMCGNMLEWCLTDYNTGTTEIASSNLRILKGGSWRDTVEEFFECSHRRIGMKYNWEKEWGFRIAKLD